ncbi:transposase, partial [Leptospira kmetyi]|uniref:transposase n=1 Tax=Leptospira kmetyi TaxID=408139 RepID=UPI003CCFEE6F
MSPRTLPHQPPFFTPLNSTSITPNSLHPKWSSRTRKSLKNSHSHYSTSSENSPFNIPFYTKITKKILNEFYPKHCPHCDDQVLTKEISTRPDVIRCEICRYQCSRLSYTPLNHFKLPLWMFGFVFHESLIQYPKVLTSSEIARKLRISYKAASLLKRRFQLLCSDLLPIYKDLTFKVLETQFKEFKLDPNTDTALTRRMAKKPYVCADSAVLYSASQRANKGRARYRKTGLTASIYLSEKLGGKQVGTLLHSIAIKNGPAFFTSISDTKADTIGPLLVKQLPFSTPLFTDEGYPWLFGVYKNHRSVNHSAKSKDNRYRLAKNRWCRDGVHNQVAEGNHRLVKTAFSAYGYIRPEFSQLYLDEFSFLKNANVIGLEALRSSEIGEDSKKFDGAHYSTSVRKGGKG